MVWLILLYSFTISAWISLGHFPIPSIDDPKYLNLDLLYCSVWYVFPIVMINIPIWIVFLIILIISNKANTNFIVTFMVGSIIILVQVFLDPFNIIYWYLD